MTGRLFTAFFIFAALLFTFISCDFFNLNPEPAVTPPLSIAKIEGGNEFTMILLNDGSVWMSGRNDWDQFGMSATSMLLTNRFIKVYSGGAVNIACGDEFSFILDSGNNLWASGQSYAGQFGRNFRTNHFILVEKNVKNMDGGHYYADENISLIVRQDETVGGGGYDSYSQLGRGAPRALFFIYYLDYMDDVKYAKCGTYHALILKNDGTLWVSGLNHKGQFGRGYTSDTNRFIQAFSGVSEAACGEAHSLILLYDGTVWAAGDNSVGQLGTGDYTLKSNFTQVFHDAKAIDCGWQYSLVLKNDDTLWACGKNSTGAIAIPGSGNTNIFVQIADNVRMFSAGGYHTLVLKKDGTLWATGFNGWGGFGGGYSFWVTNSFVPINFPPAVSVY